MTDIAADLPRMLSRRDAQFSEDAICGRSEPSSRADNATVSDSVKIAVIIITCQRPDVLRQTVTMLQSQTLRPHEIIISASDAADVPLLPSCKALKVVFGPRGACRQRNTAIASLSQESEIIVFFDDDFLPHPRWLEAAERCFRDRPAVDCLTGFLLADGIGTGGLSFDEGLGLINTYCGKYCHSIEERYSPYGCNMAYRRDAVTGLSFDEKLVLYGWLEDRDFAATVARRGGRQIKTGAAVGVHLGVTRGRVSGLRLGYSQIVNPIYLFRKRNMSFSQLADHILRNFGMNSVRCLFPERHIDRFGRLFGNILGFFDLVRGIVEPERAEQLVWRK